jgi:phosphatidylglycerol:prolipoprotein diacylglycerol transferase
MPLSLQALDPIAISIGPIAIRWYSLAYIAGILFGLFWIKKNNEGQKLLSVEAYDAWIAWIVLSILLGGRIGYVLLYNFSYFLENPLEIFAFWHGGMSFHGGLIGSVLGMWLFAKKYKIDFLKFGDVLCSGAPVGLFFGRLANFVNMELYGRVTDSKFGVIFPNAGELPRHPSQLYEAFLEGILLFIILLSLKKFTKFGKKPGSLSGTFLILYGSFRFLIENFREPDEQIGFIFAANFLPEITMGQLLSLPIILAGFLVIFAFSKK